MISPSQRPLPDNTQHSQQTNVHASSGIRTHNLSRRAAVDLRLRSRGYWDRLIREYFLKYCLSLSNRSSSQISLSHSRSTILLWCLRHFSPVSIPYHILFFKFYFKLIPQSSNPFNTWCSSSSARIFPHRQTEQNSHPYNITDKNRVLRILTCTDSLNITQRTNALIVCNLS